MCNWWECFYVFANDLTSHPPTSCDQDSNLWKLSTSWIELSDVAIRNTSAEQHKHEHFNTCVKYVLLLLLQILDGKCDQEASAVLQGISPFYIFPGVWNYTWIHQWRKFKVRKKEYELNLIYRLCWVFVESLDSVNGICKSISSSVSHICFCWRLYVKCKIISSTWCSGRVWHWGSSYMFRDINAVVFPEVL